MIFPIREYDDFQLNVIALDMGVQIIFDFIHHHQSQNANSIRRHFYCLGCTKIIPINRS